MMCVMCNISSQEILHITHTCRDAIQDIMIVRVIYVRHTVRETTDRQFEPQGNISVTV